MRSVPAGAIVFVGAFALFVACAAPGLYLRDAGELSTAAFTLGVAHPTGFALWCLVAKAATLVPFGEIAFRVTLLSAAGGAATAWLAYRVVRALAPADPAALVAGVGAALLVCAGLVMFRASTVPEVYAPTAAALALAIALFARTIDGDRRAGIVLALVGGLSLGLHAHLRLLVGPAAIVVALWRLRRGDRWPLVATTAVALGAAVVAYLPLRAAREPAANWSDPKSITGVVAHLSAARIRRAFAGEMFHDVGAHLAALVRMTEAQLGLVALLFALGGIVWLVSDQRRRPLGLVLVVVLVGDLLYSAAINPMAIDDLQDGHPTALCLAIAAGAGVLAAARRLGRASPWAAGVMAVLLCVPAALADDDAKLGLAAEAATWTRAALAEAAPRGRISVESDDLAAGTTYEQYVAGARPDVVVAIRQHAWDTAEVAAREKRAGDGVHAPTLWEPGADPFPSTIVPDVPLYHVVAGVLPPPRPLVERVTTLLAPARDPTVRLVECEQLVALGRAYTARRDLAHGAALFEAALAVRPNDDAATVDLAVTRAERGDFRGALALVDAVLARDPKRYTARVNAARYRLALGDREGARRDVATAAATEHGRNDPEVRALQKELDR